MEILRIDFTNNHAVGNVVFVENKVIQSVDISMEVFETMNLSKIKNLIKNGIRKHENQQSPC